jgi:glycosyltransferase involved in cell wall biosynthesis
MQDTPVLNRHKDLTLVTYYAFIGRSKSRGHTVDGRAFLRSVGNAPAAATVLVRHLARGSRHVDGVPQPWRTPAYGAALSALERGELTEARRLAASTGPAGALLRRVVAGEIAVATPTAPPARTSASDPGEVVLHLVTNALPETVAGYTVRTHGIARAQRARGLDVHVATRIGFPVTQGHLDAAPRVSVDGIEHHRTLPARLPLRADAALARDVELTSRLVRSLRPAVLHAHSNHVNAQVALALRQRFGIPVVYEVRGFLEETWRSRSSDPEAGSADAYQWARAAETQCLRAADAVVTLSEVMRAEIVSRGVDPARVTVVPNCVDLALAVAGAELPETTPPGGTLTVGTVGTLNDYEGLDVLVEAVAQLRRGGLDVRLRLVGDGPARAALEKRVADLGIADATTFTGRVPRDRVVAQHRAIDVFCVPRHDLPVTRLVPPLKPVEAMALGRPVVASDLPPLREIVTNGTPGQDRGLLVPAGDAEALADALTHLVHDPDLRRRLGATAQDWVARTRTWEAAAESYQQIYTRIQGETP